MVFQEPDSLISAVYVVFVAVDTFKSVLIVLGLRAQPGVKIGAACDTFAADLRAHL
jgi:hypothetical protein